MDAVGVTAAKSVASGGIATAISIALGDTETISLIIVGLLASISSFIYDCAHRKITPCTIRQGTDAMKYMFYGITLMFVAFYLGINEVGRYIDMPKTAWGFIAALAAGSAVAIVEWITPALKSMIEKIIGRVK